MSFVRCTDRCLVSFLSSYNHNFPSFFFENRQRKRVFKKNVFETCAHKYTHTQTHIQAKSAMSECYFTFAICNIINWNVLAFAPKNYYFQLSFGYIVINVYKMNQNYSVCMCPSFFLLFSTFVLWNSLPLDDFLRVSAKH